MVRGCGDRRMQLRTEAERGSNGDSEAAVSYDWFLVSLKGCLRRIEVVIFLSEITWL